MRYQGQIGCAAECWERLRFSIRVPAEDEEGSSGELAYDAEMGLAMLASELGWRWDEVTVWTRDGDEQQVCGWFCPRHAAHVQHEPSFGA